MNRHESQRGYFAHALYEQMKINPNIYLLVGDLGYKMFDDHFSEFPDRCINCGAAEQAMIGLGVGLALEGKIPFCYSITTFLLRRPYETLKLYLEGENIPVQLVGSGRDKDYSHDGPSHDASDAHKILDSLTMKRFFPDEKEEIPNIVDQMIQSKIPSFISLKR